MGIFWALFILVFSCDKVELISGKSESTDEIVNNWY